MPERVGRGDRQMAFDSFGIDTRDERVTAT